MKEGVCLCLLCVCVNACVSVCKSECACVRVCVCELMCVWFFVYVCMRTRVRACMCVDEYARASIHIYTFAHTMRRHGRFIHSADIAVSSSRTFAQHVFLSSHIMCTHAQHSNNKALFPQKNLIQQPQKSLYICIYIYIYIYIANLHGYIAARSSMVCTHESNAHL